MPTVRKLANTISRLSGNERSNLRNEFASELPKHTKSGKVRFKAPNSRHIKSNKTGTQVQSYRKSRYARTGDLRYLKKLLNRGLRSEEQHVADDLARAAKMEAAA